MPDVTTTMSELALGVVAGAHHPRVGAPDRARLEHVEPDAGRFLIGDVDDHASANCLSATPRATVAPTFPCSSDDSDFPSHCYSSLSKAKPQRTQNPQRKMTSASPAGSAFLFYMCLMMASPNSDVFNSVAPSISLAKS